MLELNRVLIADLELPGADSMALLEGLQQREGARPAVILTGKHIDVDTEARAGLPGAVAPWPRTARPMSSSSRSTT